MPQPVDKYSFLKKIGIWAAGYSAFVVLSAGIFTIAEPHVDAYIERVHQAHVDSQKDPSKKSLRKLISEETGISEDRVHITIGEWWKSHKKTEEFLDEIYPMLKEELDCILPRLRIQESGRAKWLNVDGEEYDASIGQDDFYWFYHPTKGWLPCKV